MIITVSDCARLLKENDNILILTHQSPDGDTLGSGFGLCHVLQSLGKTARVECSDKIDESFDFLYNHIKNENFEPSFVVAVDVADTILLGKRLSEYREKIDLCIDHHSSNKFFADKTCLDANAAATAEIIYRIALELGFYIDEYVANALYTGIATDTGCFQFDNTTSKTHIISAELIDKGADISMINRRMFEEKSKNKIMLEKMALNSIEYFLGDKVAILTITNEMMEFSGAKPSDLDGINAIPRQILGVLVGITIKEKEKDTYKMSVRTHAPINASKICECFGGGGHRRASGCQLKGPIEENKKKLIEILETMI